MATRRYGEDIICSDRRPQTRAEAKLRAISLSSSKNHGWARVWYLRGSRLMRETYSDGKLFSTGEWPGDSSPWYSSRLTIRQAIARLQASLGTVKA